MAKTTRPAAAVDAPALVMQTVWQAMEIRLVGDSKLVIHRFGEKALENIKKKQTHASKEKRGARDFEQDYRECLYRKSGDPETYGIKAMAFHHAIIAAARAFENVTMAMLKQSIEVIPDFVDEDGEPMVQIRDGKPEMRIDPMPNGRGPGRDLRVRAQFWPWSVRLRVRFNPNLVSQDQMLALIVESGRGVGVGEGRPGSRVTAGCGWGKYSPEDAG